MSGDVVEVIVIRKEIDDNRFRYPQMAAEFAISLAGEKITDEERNHLRSIFDQLLEKVGY